MSGPRITLELEDCYDGPSRVKCRACNILVYHIQVLSPPSGGVILIPCDVKDQEGVKDSVVYREHRCTPKSTPELLRVVQVLKALQDANYQALQSLRSTTPDDEGRVA